MRNFYRALFHCEQGHVVLGRKLRPFSNWHRVQMMAIKSPLFGFPGATDLAALTVAVSVCVTAYPIRFLAPQGFFERLLHHRAKKDAAADLGPASRAWANYLHDYDSLPHVFVPQHAKECQCPGPLAMWASLKIRGYSESEAWDKPIDTAAWAKVAMAEAEGAEVKMLTEKARKAMVAAGWGKIMPHLLEEELA